MAVGACVDPCPVPARPAPNAVGPSSPSETRLSQ